MTPVAIPVVGLGSVGSGGVSGAEPSGTELIPLSCPTAHPSTAAITGGMDSSMGLPSVVSTTGAVDAVGKHHAL